MSFTPILKFGEKRWEYRNLTLASYDEAAKVGTDLAMRFAYRARAALGNNPAARRELLLAVDFDVAVSDLPVTYRVTDEDVLAPAAPRRRREKRWSGWLSRLGRH